MSESEPDDIEQRRELMNQALEQARRKFNTREKVERTDVGYRLTVESKRGTETRDQDIVEGEIRTESLEQLLNERADMLSAVADTMNQRRLHQPDSDKEE